MTDLMLPAPDGNNDHNSPDDSPNSNQSRAQYTRRCSQRKAVGIPDEDTCLRALGQLPGLVTLGYIKNSEANTITRVYSTILQHLAGRRRSVGDSQGVSDATLVEMVRQNPELMNLLEDLFTDEQIDVIMKKVKEDDDGQV